MSNLAHKIQQQQKQPIQQRHKKRIVVKREPRISLAERCLALLFVGFVIWGGIEIVANNARIYSVNVETQKLESSIKEQQKLNDDLYVQVQELSSYERIWTMAQQLGLQLNENNVKVVQD